MTQPRNSEPAENPDGDSGRDLEVDCAIGVDIGGTKVLAAVVNTDGQILQSLRIPTPGAYVLAVETAITTAVTQLQRDHEVVAVGIAAAGFVDRDQSSVLFSPHLAWRREPLRHKLSARLGRPVLVDNDANAAAWGEYRFGAARGARRLVCITLGTGIGGGMVMDGQLERGANGMAGEFGHMVLVPNGHRCECGNRGCWEQYASGNALGREARELVKAGSVVAAELLARVEGRVERIVGSTVADAALAGDPTARELLHEMGRWLGLGMANLAAALDPDQFIVGGGVSAAAEEFIGSTRDEFGRALTGRGYRPFPRIERAMLGAEAGVVGIADLARAGRAHVDPSSHPSSSLDADRRSLGP